MPEKNKRKEVKKNMSVILFNKNEVYQDLANAYEGLKDLQRIYHEIDDQRFYNSLRRMYFANVATYLCQYHDESKLSEKELLSIDSFAEITGVENSKKTYVQHMHDFLKAWGSLQYNCYTNDGEQYIAKNGQEYIESLIDIWIRELFERIEK